MPKDSYFYPPESRVRERAVLVGTALAGADREEEEENLLELARLARAAGAKVLQAIIQERRAPDVSTYIGRGKVTELEEICKRREANLIIFDNELSPVQARNLEHSTGINVCDRTELILDIFAQRAQTKQAHLQVELAQLEYLRPRLRRMWEHLSRQAGGIGTRGPGETQLEVDRRRLGERVSRLKRELEKIGRISETKAQRRRKGAFSVAMAGYTNVGKSSLMNALTHAEVFVDDALFATLDATTRRLKLSEGEEILLTDTVGFVRKLPHRLVESFKATLAELREADLILHIIDLSSPQRDRQIEAVEEVLGEMDVDPGNTLQVFNKMDRLGSSEAVEDSRARWPEALLVSAATGEGLDELKAAMRRRRQAGFREAILRVPIGLESITGRIYENCEVRDVRYDGGSGALYRLRATPADLERLRSLGAELHEELMEGWDAGN